MRLAGLFVTDQIMKENDHPLPLETRSGLPDALRELVEQYPRDIWEGHGNFDGLVKFWLERHVMFRRLLAVMQEDLNKLEAKSLDPAQYHQRLARLGNLFVSDLHMHHNIEDHQYFPALLKLENRLARGFEILDHDHHAIDGHLEAFTQNANALLQSNEQDQAGNSGTLAERLTEMEKFLDRHLTDEEELVVPIVLKHGFSF